MFSEEERKTVLVFYVPLMVAWGILYLCGYHITYFGDPIVGWLLLVPWTIYLLYSWKDKKGLFKRCVLALPFALLTVVLLKLTVFRNSSPWPFGILMFILLTRETKSLKGGFVISLIIGTILIGLLAILVILIKSILAGPVE